MDMAHTALVVQTHWQRLRPLILKAIPFMNGSHEEADLIEGVLAGEFTFWHGDNSFALAAIEKHKRLTRCNLFLAGGNPKECLRLRDKVEQWGKSKGATQFFTMVRPALDRINREGSGPHAQGWTRGATVYVKEI